MKAHSDLSRPSRRLLVRYFAAALILLTALVWSRPAYCGRVHELAASGDLVKLRTLLQTRPSLAVSKNEDGSTPLHYAANAQIASLLLAKGARVDARTNASETPLHFAARDGRTSVAELLLAKGADANALTRNGDTPLHLAALRGQREVAELLLAKGAELNRKDNDGATPLHLAASNGRKELAEFLQQQGGKDPLAEFQEAVTAGNLARVKELLSEDPSLVSSRDRAGQTPLHQAAMWGKKDLAALLLESQAPVNAVNGSGETPLHMAVARSRKEIVELLLASQAEVNARDANGNTPLFPAAREDNKDIAQLLLARGADVNARNKENKTPLILAVTSRSRDSSDLLALLLAQHADAAVKDRTGKTALDYAAQRNFETMVTALLANQYDAPGLVAVVADDKRPIVVRRAALGLVNDQPALMQFAATLPVPDLRATAVRKVADQNFLVARSIEDTSAAVRIAALTTLKSPDANFLLQRSRDDISAAARVEAVRAMKSSATLVTVATESYYGELRSFAAKYPSLTPAERSAIASAHAAIQKQITAMATETDQPALAEAALHGKFDSVCLAAANRLTDQTLLAKVVMQTTDHDVARVIFAKLTDPTALGEVATGAGDLAVRTAAAVALNQTSWQEVFAKAAKAGDSKSIGDAIAALSLAPNREGIGSSVVTQACLMLIRRGDESRIPELVELLNLYGDKPLCEDYLNSGQPDLHSAGESWAGRHGYRIRKGAGSHRANWGSDR
jgi:cytohesin